MTTDRRRIHVETRGRHARPGRLRSVVSGQWPVVSGLWSVACGPWPRGLWSVATRAQDLSLVTPRSAFSRTLSVSSSEAIASG